MTGLGRSHWALSAAVLALLAGCGQLPASSGGGAATATATPVAPSVLPSPSATSPTIAVCSPAAPVAGCEMLADPFGVPTNCHVTAGVLISPPRPPETKLPNYGFGRGPVYLSGQNSWYFKGQTALLLVAASVRGTVNVGGHIDGGTLSPAFDGRATVQLRAGSPTPYWRYWQGELSFPAAGCYSLTFTGAGANDVVVIYAHTGAALAG